MTNEQTDTRSTGAYECELCGETFGDEWALRQHVRSMGVVD